VEEDSSPCRDFLFPAEIQGGQPNRGALFSFVLKIISYQGQTAPFINFVLNITPKPGQNTHRWHFLPKFLSK
jgi:hypothetical protein